MPEHLVTTTEKMVIDALYDLPLTARPFAEVGQLLGLTEDEVLAIVHDLMGRQLIRRLAGVLWHRQAGFTANAMVVWRVPEERVKEVGEILARFPEVTHCYERSPQPGWQYNVFTMIHGTSKEQCEELAARLAREVNLDDYRLLFSTTELKKTSPRYFAREGENRG